MAIRRASLRKCVAWAHVWLGIVGGLFFGTFAVTGAIVTFRPQIASLLSPRPDVAGQCRTIDWTTAEREIEAATTSSIHRIYFPEGSDPRFHFRMLTGNGPIYRHVIYDACSGRILGDASLEWLDWIVDAHHNLLAGKIGRQVVGVIGIATLLSAAGGALLWLLSRPTLKRAFRVQARGPARRLMFDLHRAVGLASVSLILLQVFTGLWLCYPAALGGILGRFATMQPDAKPTTASRAGGATDVGLQQWIQAANRAIPDGRIREIRAPEGSSRVHVRVWRPGDFRSLGNNVVSVDRSTAEVLAMDLYSSKPASKRFIQAMTGLHYGEWGGIVFRSIYGVSGLALLPLFLTGFIFWWLARRRSIPESFYFRKVFRSSIP